MYAMPNKIKNINDLVKLHDEPFFLKNFKERYFTNLPMMASHLFGANLTYQQIDILNRVNFKGGRLCVPSGHGTGKTFIIGVLCSCFMLLFPQSIVRILAPKREQITTYSFKEIIKCFNNFTTRSEWGFMSRFFQINDTRIYVKNYKKSWYIEPISAQKNKSERLAGQHNRWLLLVIDEASGVEDGHILSSLGALTDAFNSCVMFSQHTRNSGKFNDFITIQSKEQGGIWDVLRLSSENSPLVTKESINFWKMTYTANEYDVKCRGLSPSQEEGVLLGITAVDNCFNEKSWLNKYNFTTVFSADLAYVGQRDSTVLIECSMCKVEIKNKEVIFCILRNIEIYRESNKKMPIEFVETVFAPKVISKARKIKKQVKACLDANAGGHEAGQRALELFENTDNNIDIDYMPIKWGSKKMSLSHQARFLNQRAKAYVLMKECIDNNRFYIGKEATVKSGYKTRLKSELIELPFKYTKGSFKYQMLDKESMAKKGISSPDVADAIAQCFLMDINSSIENIGIELEEDLAVEKEEDEYLDIEVIM